MQQAPLVMGPESRWTIVQIEASLAGGVAKGGMEGDVGNVDVGDSYRGTLEACRERRPSNRKLLRAEMGVNITMGVRNPWLLGRVP